MFSCLPLILFTDFYNAFSSRLALVLFASSAGSWLCASFLLPSLLVKCRKLIEPVD